ncbi:uncharacterized protein LOC131236041 [Magnolia sinica]|uniref:uncharacterized protein LOC131236041 n=1 Tax=Magnolia sinica TaxID=86752 RepID=UPI0026596823|nr:uncharacterized protein LOC131236041 [Magnolia sinica]
MEDVEVHNVMDVLLAIAQEAKGTDTNKAMTKTSRKIPIFMEEEIVKADRCVDGESLTLIPESEEEALEAELEEEALEAELEEEESVEAELEEEESVEVELEEETMEADAQQEKAVGAAVISDQKAETRSNNSKLPVPQAQSLEHSDLHPKGWEAIPKPKGHSGLDYSRWDRVEDDSSEEEDEEEDVQP